MKYIFSVLFAAILFNKGYAQNFESIKDRTGKKLLKGFVTDSLLLADTLNFGWFAEHEKVYTPADKIVNSFNRKKNSISFLIFLGTWCTDSQYIIPRFFKIVQQAQFGKERITLFALDRTKRDVANLAANFNISHVPTIIILKNGKELGRVIEYGTTGKFDEDLSNIIDAID